MKRFVMVLAITAVVFLSACSVPGTSKTPSGQSGAGASQEPVAASDFELESIEGAMVRLSELKGKPVVINFLTTWCGYCSLELPSFLSLKQEYGENVEFLFVDVQESKSTVEKYREKKGFENFSPLLDSDGSVAAAYGITGFPTTIVVDSDGNISEVHRGMINEDTLREAIEVVKSNE